MTTFESIVNLSSFEDCNKEVISRKTMGKVLEAGRQAPSPGNAQSLEFVVVEDEGRREMLSNTVNDKRIAKAPTAVIVIADEDRMTRHVGEDLCRDFCNAEAATAVQNMRLVASEEGIASCWVSGFDSQSVADQFNVPAGKRTLSVISFCYTDSPVGRPQKFGMNSVCFYEEYGNQVGSVFDAFEFKGIRETNQIYGRKTRGFFNQLKRKLRKFL